MTTSTENKIKDFCGLISIGINEDNEINWIGNKKQFKRVEELKEQIESGELNENDLI